MSYDIFVQDIPDSANTIEDIPDDFTPQEIGSRNEIISSILEIVPEADFSDPTWGNINGESFSIEVNLGEDEILTSFALHANGDKTALTIISAILNHLDLRGFDPDGIFDPKRSSKSFKNWKEYRDFVINNSEA
jgi:hypothetical protein